MAPQTYKRIVLNSRPEGDFEPDTFRTEVLPFTSLGQPGKQQVLVQCTWLSLDPNMRAYVRDARSYLPPVQIGEIMRGLGIGVVIATGEESKFQVGDYVTGTVTGPWGMTEYAVIADNRLEKLELYPGIEPLDYLNTLGLAGLTAYFGLKKIAELKAGDKLVVSGAAGSVGTIACQLGKAAGAKVYAIAGSPDKCEWLKELGVEKAFNYKDPTWMKDFEDTVGYLDVYFDNVGGDILDFMLTRLNKNARIVLCGAISGYISGKPKGLQEYTNLISQRGKIQGFMVYGRIDYEDEYPVALKEMAQGLASGKLKRRFHIVEGGIEEAPKALPLLFSGGNTGKLVVRVSQEPKF